MIGRTAPDYAAAREAMVSHQLVARGIRDARVLQAMRTVPRHLFVPASIARAAHADAPLPIGHGQTISQPFIVATMLEALELGDNDAVLDVGTGCGYQAAVLSLLARKVVSIEVVPELARAARARLKSLGFANVEVVLGDGGLGWPPGAPYDAIVVAASCPKVPRPLIEQLSEAGRLVAPVGDLYIQNLIRVRLLDGRASEEDLGGCQFVPLVGRHGWSA
jgi:protein-L-isoaspartate(D-aspartate) O-methyltransferase